MAWHEALFPNETVLPVSADKLRVLFIYLFSVFNQIPLCMADPKNSSMWIGNHKAEY